MTEASESELAKHLSYVNGAVIDSFGETQVCYTIEVPKGTEKQAVEYFNAQKPLIISVSLNQLSRTQ